MAFAMSVLVSQSSLIAVRPDRTSRNTFRSSHAESCFSGKKRPQGRFWQNMAMGRFNPALNVAHLTSLQSLLESRSGCFGPNNRSSTPTKIVFSNFYLAEMDRWLGFCLMDIDREGRLGRCVAARETLPATAQRPALARSSTARRDRFLEFPMDRWLAASDGHPPNGTAGGRVGRRGESFRRLPKRQHQIANVFGCYIGCNSDGQ